MESFVFHNGEKYCNVYYDLDHWGKFLYQLSVRTHEAGFDHTADGAAQGRVIRALRCRANNLEKKQRCDGCKMLEHHKRIHAAKNGSSE